MDIETKISIPFAVMSKVNIFYLTFLYLFRVKLCICDDVTEWPEQKPT